MFQNSKLDFIYHGRTNSFVTLYDMTGLLMLVRNDSKAAKEYFNNAVSYDSNCVPAILGKVNCYLFSSSLPRLRDSFVILPAKESD